MYYLLMHKKNVIDPLTATQNQFNLNMTIQFGYVTMFLINEQILTDKCCTNQFNFRKMKSIL